MIRRGAPHPPAGARGAVRRCVGGGRLRGGFVFVTVLAVPSGRRGIGAGKPAAKLEVVSLIYFLASDAAGFLTGIDVPIDGGSTAKWRASGVIER